MGHLIKYKLIQTVRQKEMMFWALLFPLILGTLFYISFGNPEANMEKLEKIPVAVIESDVSGAGDNFREFLNAMDGDILKIRDMNEKEAKKALHSGKITGIFYSGNKQRLTVAANDLNESILKSLLDSYVKNEAMMKDIMENHPERLEDAMAELADYKEVTEEVSLGGRSLDNNVTYFFALIAMACLYGGFLGVMSAIEMRANLSALAARRSITPTHRLKLVVIDMGVVFSVHFVNVIILLAYLKWVLKIDIGNDPAKVLMVCFFGCLLGVSLGILIGTIGKKEMGIKIGVLLAVTMLASFLSGLMVGGMKDIVEHHAPIINRINPAALISDGFYCVTVYDDTGRFAKSVGTLAAMAVVFTVLSFLSVRRERYDSI